MAIFNAWCVRMPVLMLGATGPVDAVKRRPCRSIGYTPRARSGAAIVRPARPNGDDQPASPKAARRARLPRHVARMYSPAEPRYASTSMRKCRKRRCPLRYFDAAVRPTHKRGEAPTLPGLKSCAKPQQYCSGPGVRALIDHCVSRDPRGPGTRASPFRRKCRTPPFSAGDLKVGAAFPTDHPLHVDAAGILLRVDWLERSQKPT